MESGVPVQVRVVFTSRVLWLDVLQGLAEDLSAQLGFEEDDRYAIALAIREGVNNAIVHGNRRDPSTSVEVELLLKVETLEIRIRDDGPGFDHTAVPDPLAPENLLRPGGRGIFLIRHYMDRVDLKRAALPGGEIRMSKWLPGRGSDPARTATGR